MTTARRSDKERGMDVLDTMWWLVLIRGIAALMFGKVAFFAPAATLVVL